MNLKAELTILYNIIIKTKHNRWRQISGETKIEGEEEEEGQAIRKVNENTCWT